MYAFERRVPLSCHRGHSPLRQVKVSYEKQALAQLGLTEHYATHCDSAELAAYELDFWTRLAVMAYLRRIPSFRTRHLTSGKRW